jgi:ABC-type amino acid transport substrate-binding protein
MGYINYKNVDSYTNIINQNDINNVLTNKKNLLQNIPDYFIATRKINNENNITKKKLKVGLIISSPYIIHNTFNINGNKDGTNGTVSQYTGLVYDIWQQIKAINNFDIDQEIPLEPDYNNAIKRLNDGEFDILVGNLWIFKDRAREALYSRPLFLSKIVIAYKPKLNKYGIYYELIKKNYIMPIFIIFVIGIILGSLLYYAEPERGFTRSVWTTMSSFLGEMGFLFEESKLKFSGMFIAFIIGIIAFYYSLFLQATTTSDIIHEFDKTELSVDNLKYKRFAMPKNFDIGNILKKYNINYDSVDVSPDKIAEFYLQNTDKYDGYLSEYESIKNDIKQYNDIKISSQIYGYEENTIAVKETRDNYDLLNKINYSISILQENDNIKKLCARYFGNDDSNLCVL